MMTETQQLILIHGIAWPILLWLLWKFRLDKLCSCDNMSCGRREKLMELKIEKPKNEKASAAQFSWVEFVRMDAALKAAKKNLPYTVVPKQEPEPEPYVSGFCGLAKAA